MVAMLTILLYLAVFVEVVDCQCPTSDWEIRDGSCYLFRITRDVDISNWDEALANCKVFNASLVTLHSAEEQQYVFSTMLQTAPSSMNAWIGMYKEGFGSPYIWENGEEVQYTNWAPGEPNDPNGSQNCVRMYYSDGGWDDYNCPNSVDSNWMQHGYICKKALDTQAVLPRYEFTLSGDFTSSNGADFDNPCTFAYAESMNSKAVTMSAHVNSLIGSVLCTTISSSQVQISSVSAPFVTSGNMGNTGLFYMSVIALDISFSEVESCAVDISDYLSIHTNWDPQGEILPPEDNCPGVVFTEPNFATDGNQWICENNAQTSDEVQRDSTNTLMYRLTHNGIFQSVDGSNISTSCLQDYSNRFVLDTSVLIQEINQMIGSSLCQGQQLTVSQSLASLVLIGTEGGVSIQSYDFELGQDNSFNTVHGCTFEVSGYLADHNNWPSLLPPVDNCPELTFTNNFFSLGETEWLCV